MPFPFLALTENFLFSRTSYNRLGFGKLIFPHLIKKCHEFCETQTFIAVFVKARQWSLPWAISNHSTHCTSISLRPTDLLFSSLCLSFTRSLFPSSFKTNCYTRFSSVTCVGGLDQLIPFNLANLITFSEDYRWITFPELCIVSEKPVWCFSVQAGKTVIERNSQDSSIISPTPDSYRTFYKKVHDAIDGKSKYYIDKVSSACH
jgi:hypothetical protein